MNEIENFSNTQKLITLENKELHFKTRELALDYILENYPKQFSSWFIYKMFVKGRTNISDWLRYDIEYRTKHLGHAFRRKNLDILMNKNTNIFQIIHQLDLHVEDNLKKSNGVCILASLYSAYPRLFDFNVRNVESIISEINNPRNIFDVVNTINKRLHSNVLDIETRLSNNTFDELLRKYIDNDKYFIISETIDGKGHCIVFVGYDYDSYYYFENGIDVLQKLANTNEQNYKNTKYHNKYKNLKTIRKSDMYNFGINFLIKINIEEIQNTIHDVIPINIKNTIVDTKVEFSDLTKRLQKLIIEASNL